MRCHKLVLALALAGVLGPAHAAFVLFENFDSLAAGNIAGQAGWASSGSGGQVTNDPAGGTNKVLSATTTSANIYKALGALTISNNTTGTVFFRMRRAETGVNVSAGLSDVATPVGNFANFEVQLNCNTLPPNNLKVRDAGAFDVVDTFSGNVWYNVWLVVNNQHDLVSVYLQGGGLLTQTLLTGDTDGETAFTFRNTTGDGFNTNATPAGNNLVNFLIMTTTGQVGPFYVDDIYIDPSGVNLSEPLPDTRPPVVFTVQPAPGTTVPALTNITVTFDEIVTNVTASDLIVSGAPATNVTGAEATWTFHFPEPPGGPVPITWAASHNITDLAGNRFNGTNAGWSYTLAKPDLTPPVVQSVVPPDGATVSNLSQIVVVFSEPVVGVGAEYLLVNNVPALSVSNAGTTYFFTVMQPQPGLVTVQFDAEHSITDTAGNPFDHTQPAARPTYTFVDGVPPAVVSVVPVPGASVSRLTQIELAFSEPVAGLDAADLLINGQPATNLVATAEGGFLFEFPPAANGPVTVSWAGGHGITDTAAAPNAFAGGSWSYLNDPVAAFGDIVINEFLSDNLTSLEDEDGQRQDWIELYNRGTNAVNLLGWSLTDDPVLPGFWRFPAVTLNPGAYLVVFASAKDRKTPAPGTTNHTSFRLNADGDYLGLYNADLPAQVVSEFTPAFPEQRADVSYGRLPDGAFAHFTVPTPGAANNAASAVSGFVQPPSVSADSGFFSEPFQVVLATETPGAAIYYTLDGSSPTESSTPYTGPIPVAGTPTKAVTLLRAAAFKAGLLPSLVTTRTYIFPDHVLSQPANPPGFPLVWDSPCTIGVNCADTTADYEMDPQVLTNAAANYGPLARQGLMTIPSISIVTHPDLLFGPVQGVYVRREPFNQQPVNVEMLLPDGSEGFNLTAGLEIVGGTSPNDQSYTGGTTWKSKKLSMRLIFRGDFGSTKLRYRVFPDSPVDTFDTLIIDAGLNYVWSYNGGSSPDDQRQRAQYVRDQFMSDLQNATGRAGPHGRLVHVYLNGLYWGLHDLHERPDHSFSASYLGGDKAEYDALKHRVATVVNGTNTGYIALFNLARSGLTNNAVYEQVQQQLDVPWFIDYMLINLWAGNTDWAHQNWYASRRRTPDGRWRYFSWDAEHVLKSVNENVTTKNDANGPTELFQLLRANAEFRLLFADHVHRHFFNGGVFWVGTNAPITNDTILAQNRPASLYMRRIREIDPAIVTESARWGDTGETGTPRANTPLTRNVEWINELNALMGRTNLAGYTVNYFPQRSSIVLGQLRGLGLYPTNQPPIFSRHGGNVPAGFTLYMTNVSPGATVYFTTNGADPRVYGSGAVSGFARVYTNTEPPVLGATTTVKARSLSGTNWSALNEAVFTVAEPAPPLRITEIMYHPPGGDAHEFIELRYDGTVPLDVSGWTFQGVTFAFNTGTILLPGQVIVLASGANPAAFAAHYPGVNVFGYYAGKLDNNGERLALLKPSGEIVLSVDYRDAGGWLKAADGQGYSLELVDPLGDPDAPANWRATSLHGTPGVITPNPPPGVVRLNELMADNAGAVTNEGTFPDWVELHNTSATDVDLSGWSLTDDSDARKFVFPSNTVLPAGGFLVVWCDTNLALPGLHAGFQLNRNGETLSLFDPATNRADAITFGLQLPDYSLGRLDGDWGLTAPTPGATNVPAVTASPTNLFLNEWLANAPPGGSDWFELFNAASEPVDLRGLLLTRSNGLHQIRSLSFVAPRGHVVLFADEQPGVDHLDFNLPAAGGFIALSDSAATEFQRVTYGAQLEGVTQGRLPDGTATITNFMLSPSPGASNYVVAYTGPFLNEVLAVNRTALTNAAGHTADWVELYNPLPTEFDLSGFRLSTALDNPLQWTFPPGVVIPANGFLVVWFDNEAPASAEPGPELNTGRALDGDSDEVVLFNAAGQIVDVVEFGPQAPDYSIGRIGGDWTLLAAPSPGAVNSAAAPLGSATNLRLNEWLASATTNQDEFVELFNPGAQPVALGGLYLTDDLSLLGMTKFQVAPLSYIAPHGFTEFKADADPSQGRHHLNFRLDASAESLRLYDTNLLTIDTVVFGQQTTGASEGRLPDGAATTAAFACPTPGLSNELAAVILITEQPQSQIVALGGPVTLRVRVLGGEPLSYQWFRNGTALDVTGPEVVIPGAQLSDAGDYVVVITNTCAAVTSAVATLTVQGLPQITVQPQSRTNTVGETASFSVSVSSPLAPSYQWLFNSNSLASETNPVLTLRAVTWTNAGEYRVLVSTDAGAVVSEPATLTVVGLPALSEPVSLGAGGFQFSLSGQVFRDYAIEISSTTTNWSNAFTVTLTNSPQPVLDPAATNANPAFYRARLLP